MAAAYIALTAVVKVSVGSARGNRVAHVVRRGDVLPEGVEKEQLDRLEARGLIEKVKGTGSQTTEVTIPDGDPTDSWTVVQLEKFAATKGIDLAGAGNKPDKLATILAALAAGSSGD